MVIRYGGKVRGIIITTVIICCLWKVLLVLLRGNMPFMEMTFTFLQEEMENNYFLPVRYLNELNDGYEISRVLPLHAYLLRNSEETVIENVTEKLMADYYGLREGSDEDKKDIDEEQLDYTKNALHIENSILAEIEQENARYTEKLIQEEMAIGNLQETAKTDEGIEEQLPEMAAESGFVKAKLPVYAYDWEEEWGYEELVSNFYAVDASTALKEEYLDLDKLLYTDLSVDKQASGPQILIYHTHSQEAFADSIDGDASTTIVGAGEKLAKLLTEEYGFNVLHHKGEYDVENRDYAYSNSLPELERILKENPSIEVVIDLHRDEMKEGTKLVMDLQGRPTARFMFFDGMSYIRNKGEISYLENPHIQDNLAFSFQAQVAANQYYPGIARKIYLKAYRYNLHLCPKSILVELGAQTNTVEEIMNACDPLAHIISIVLNGEL